MNICTICKKGSSIGGRRAFLRAHYNPTGKVRKYPNLQWGRLPSGKRVKVCTRCLKKLPHK